jgi:hypothetical protein
MKARPLGQPAPNQRRLVGAIVVDDEVDVEVRGDRGVGCVDELAELDAAMPLMD